MSSANVSKRPMTAGRAKKIAKNTLVHIILAILVVIWLFPIFWIIIRSSARATKKKCWRRQNEKTGDRRDGRP